MASCDIYTQVHPILDKHKEEMGRSLVKSLEKAKHITIDELIQITKRRNALRTKILELFTEYDILLTPAMPTEPFQAKGPPPSEINGHPVGLLGAVAFTYPFNLTGNPCSVVRSGITPSGLPAGVQIVGPIYRDELVLQVSRIFEEINPWRDQWPEM